MEPKINHENKNTKSILKNKTVLFIISLILLIIIIIILVYFIYFPKIIEKKEVEARVIVSDHYGFEINGTALIFGMISPGSVSEKKILVQNNYGRDVKIEFFIEGEIEKFVTVEQNDFILKKDEVRNVSFYASASRYAQNGTYYGKMITIIKQA